MTAGYVAQLEAVAEAARAFCEFEAPRGTFEYESSYVDKLHNALAALAPAGGTIELTAEQAEKVREALRLGKETAGIMHSEFPDNRTYAEVAAPFDEALAALAPAGGTAKGSAWPDGRNAVHTDAYHTNHSVRSEAVGTIVLTGEQAEKVRAYIVECRDWFGDDPVAMSLRDEADPVLSLLSRGQEK